MKSSADPISLTAPDAVHRLLVAVGLLVAFMLRLHRLGAESLWYDETVSAYLARQPLVEAIAHTARDIHPPGYYALLHFWSLLTAPFGSAALEYLLAFPSVWFGVLSIALLVPLGRKLLGPRPATMAVWLAVLSPFLLWYAQEVRMYTVAAALGLLCLCAALNFVQITLSPQHDRSFTEVAWLTTYAIAAAAGLYTLYFFAFGLIAINLAVLLSLLIGSRTQAPRRVALGKWTLAQLGVLFLFLPWLTTAVRQAVDPPVPPWRLPWDGIAAVATDMASSLSAYLVGQSVPAAQTWLWALFTIVLTIAYYGYTKSMRTALPLSTDRVVVHWLPLYAFVPALLIFVLSLSLTPLFHVRYLAAYAPAYSLIAAAGLLAIYSRRRAVAAALLLILFMGSAYSLSRYWRHPDYRPDDHRAAVALLARNWRPGDAILVNAGWVYTAIDTYWPSALQDAYSAVPPSPIRWTRLTDAASSSTGKRHSDNADAGQRPVGTISGSVNGDASLGWGSRDADFYAISEEDTIAALESLAGEHDRIWHYRLYDTVNDPDGLIRAWLEHSQTLGSATPLSGPGYLLLEQYNGESQYHAGSASSAESVVFDDRLQMHAGDLPRRAPAGSYLYAPVTWTPLPSFAAGNGLAASLRLVDEDGRLWAQLDEALPDLIPHALAGRAVTQVLALPIPASTPPGTYDLQFVVYRADTLKPLPANADGNIDLDAIPLGKVEVDSPDKPIIRPRTLTRFDYLELIEARLPATLSAASERLHADLVWRPGPSEYADSYTARFSLANAANTVIASWEAPLGSPQHPSSVWEEGALIRDQHDLELPEDLTSGDYSLRLEVVRTSDGLQIPARRFAWLPVTASSYDLGSFTIRP